ncbi:twin-arginine translocase TatA/TatE family subunit [Streptomyces sp. NPDC058001]|uniref:twin-arginine translocase TatA/TatE family subunit n=1 Tax=Streptomyces sp. NPDC058001 TaxID=3346300 RepID=UPI0036E995D1
MFGLSELALILIVVAVILAVKKLPELTRSAGKAARILKSETKALKEEGKTPGDGPASGTRSASAPLSGTVVNREGPTDRP